MGRTLPIVSKGSQLLGRDGLWEQHQLIAPGLGDEMRKTWVNKLQNIATFRIIHKSTIELQTLSVIACVTSKCVESTSSFAIAMAKFCEPHSYAEQEGLQASATEFYQHQ